jgi:hypothetical protein
LLAITAGRKAERVHQRRVDLVGVLWPARDRVVRLGRIVGGAVADVEEELPVDRPVRRDRAHAAEVACWVGGGGEDLAARQRLVEPVDGTDHRVPEAVGGHRELDGHQRKAVVAGQAGHGRVLGHGRPGGEVREDVLHGGRVDQRREEVIDHDPLVVPAHQVANGREVGVGHRSDDGVVEAQHRGLQLGDDAVLVVAGVADEGASVGAARHVDGVRVAVVARHGVAQLHPHPVVEVGLVVGAAAVETVEVEPRCPEAHQVLQLLRVEPLAQRRGRVEGQVMVDELAEVGVGGRDPAVLLGVGRIGRLGCRWHVGACGHCQGERAQVVFVVRLVRLGVEEPGEPPLHRLVERDATQPVPPGPVS